MNREGTSREGASRGDAVGGDATDLDLCRAWADGTLDEGARAEFARRLDAEPELAETLAAWSLARTWPDGAVPAYRTGFEAIRLEGDGAGDGSGEGDGADDAAVEPTRGDGAPDAAASPADLGGSAFPAGRTAASARARWAPLAIAAAALLALGGAWALGRARSGDEPGDAAGTALALAEIPLEAPLALEKAPPVPSALGDYRPSDAKGLRLLAHWEEARAVAETGRRPTIAFVYHPTCPWCVHMREGGPFQDARVAVEADAFVLVGIDMTNGMPENLKAMLELDPPIPWPWFLVLGPDGERVGGFGGDHDADELVRALNSAAGALPSSVRASWRPWAEVHRLHDELAAAEGERDARKRFSALRRLASEDAAGPVGRRAAWLVADAKARARRALLATRDVAARDGAGRAAEAIDAALAAFSASPADAVSPEARADLLRVRERLRADGRFPRLEAPR